MTVKKVLVLGAGGFIGSHLVKRLKREGYWVCGVDLKYPEWSETEADEFIIGDLRDSRVCFNVMSGGIDEVYQLAADMGGVGFIHTTECDIMHNNALININAIHATVKAGIKRYLFSSSVCVYRDMKVGDAEMVEEEAYPAMPGNEYGWEKLYAERMIQAYARHYGMITRIARLQNCYGPEGTWQGGREKAPAALSCKVAEAKDGGVIEVWGNGEAIRSYTYIDDMLDGILLLMKSDLKGPVNIGFPEYITVDELVLAIIEASGKRISIEYVEGPVGVASRNFSNARINSIGWKAKFSLKDGIALTYLWILDQLKKNKNPGFPPKKKRGEILG